MKTVSEKASIGRNVTIGEYTVIAEDVTIGDNVLIGNNVVIHQGTKIGDNIRIDDQTVIGKQPMRAVNSIFQDEDRQPPAEIAEGSIIGTGVVIYAGSKLDREVLVADLATIREDVQVGERTIVGRNVTIENYCQVGSNCKLQTNSYITAYSKLEDHVFIAPGVVTSNDNYVGRSRERFKHHKGVTVKRGGRVGANATILPGKVIGEDSLVAAGSVVTKDTPPRKVVMGAPARVVGDVPAEQLLENQ